MEAREEALEKFNTDKTTFGFWVYLMTDLIMFAVLFAAFAVLRNNTFGGPGADELFSLPYVLAETMLLLASSFTAGLGLLAAHAKKRYQTLSWFGLTFLLGFAFLVLELNEFTKLFMEGNGFQRSGFLSSYFTLVGTHGLHISFGLIWMAIMIEMVLYRGLTSANIRKLTLLSLFWHFLDIVWIFIFTIVYLIGAL